ncbi:GNAT family N-acetyltransferase [Aliidiomarina halalkaliphila]|uniref:GNAT family N-acetyltransferase n=1 Tax=Aliidiomarina halalkaliphila TaxID=2593535 RepID=A0A552WZU4_9GAMM|nr:bifunctional GNAT family N-acetyltransferase/hotdog fold thioesterase [Aliidiomarina halalkaliphila]TRW48327.1 GNAT family N-acetyltransferase [Aliidiomarina halalkaliphila]
MEYQIVAPKTKQEFEDYYDLRYQVLREPFQRPRGSEKDEYDLVGEHRMLIDANKQLIGIGRLHFNSREEAQVRFMVVKPGLQGEGHGVRLLHALEILARENGAKRVIIRSRDATLGFYLKCGYELHEEGNTVDNPMAEHLLVKTLDPVNHIIYRPQWCVELEATWHQKIPISEAMGIRVHQYTGREFELRAPLPRNINLHNTMFAGSIYTLATLTGWGLISLQMQERGISGAVVLADGHIQYQQPVRSHPRGLVHLRDLEGDMSVVEQGRNAHLKLTTYIYDGDNEAAAATFTGQYVILAPRDK